MRSGPQTLQLRGELCLASLTMVSDALARVEGSVTLELSELTFMDSTGLRVILTRLRESPVELVNVLPQVARLLALSGLEACEDLHVRLAAV